MLQPTTQLLTIIFWKKFYSSKVLGEGQSDLPGLVFGCCNDDGQSVSFIFFLVKELSNLLQAV